MQKACEAGGAAETRHTLSLMRVEYALLAAELRKSVPEVKT